MVQCEMCGTETSNPNRVKIEGAELDVCDECTDFGTELRTDEEESTTSTKYSTSSSGSSGSGTSSSSGQSSTGSGSSSSTSSGGGRRRDMFDDIEEIAQDYDDQIRSARESAGLSQEELAKKLNEKASQIRKLEHGETLPTDEMQSKLEGELGITLSASGGGGDEADWEGDSGAGEYTLGDVVKRKDS